MTAKFVAAGAALCTAVVLFSAGAGAVFADADRASQKIGSGLLKVSVQGPWTSKDAKTATFAESGPVGSTFTTGPRPVVIKNAGTVLTTSLSVGASATFTNATLHNEVYVEVDIWQKPDHGGSFVVLYNGPLVGLESSPRTLPVRLSPAHSFYAFVTIYAGANGRNSLHALEVGTGSSADNAPSLTAAAQGGAITPDIHFDFTG